MEDIEKKAIGIEDKLFDGELVTRGENQTTDRKLRQQQQPQQRQMNTQESGQSRTPGCSYQTLEAYYLRHTCIIF